MSFQLTNFPTQESQATVNALHVNDSMQIDDIPSLSISSGKSAPGIRVLEKVEEGRSSLGGHEIVLAQNSAYLSAFLILNTMIGSGILNQPFVFYNGGILGGIIGFAFSSVAIWYSLIILTDVGLELNILEYSGLAKKAFPRFGEYIIDLSIVVGGTGAIMGYILIIGELVSLLLVGWGCNEDDCSIYTTIMVMTTCFVVPLCMFRHFGHLAWISVFSISAISMVLMLVIIGGPIISHNKGYHKKPVRIFDAIGALQSLGSIVFALSCAPANFQAFVSTEAKSQNLKDWQYICLYAVGAGTAMCASMGLAGYLSFRDVTQGDILTDFNGHAFDFFKLMVVFHLTMYIPIDFVVLRYSFVNITLGMKSEHLHVTYHVAITLSLLAVFILLVMALLLAGLSGGEAFSLVVSLSGGVAGSISSFILPAGIYLELMPEDAQYYQVAKCLFYFGWVVMVAVLTGTVLSFTID